jgi:hypothetical protein
MLQQKKDNLSQAAVQPLDLKLALPLHLMHEYEFNNIQAHNHKQKLCK